MAVQFVQFASYGGPFPVLMLFFFPEVTSPASSTTDDHLRTSRFAATFTYLLWVFDLPNLVLGYRGSIFQLSACSLRKHQDNTSSLSGVTSGVRLLRQSSPEGTFAAVLVRRDTAHHVYL